MNEVEAIVNGTAKWKTSREIMIDSVTMCRMERDARKGEENCFGGLLEIARGIYTEYHQKREQLNDPSMPFYKLASAKFKTQYEADIQYGCDVMGFTKEDVKKYAGAGKLIYDEMVAGSDFLELDSKGNFVVQGKTRLEQRKKKRKDDEEAKEAARNADALRAFTGEPEIVVDNTKPQGSDPFAGASDTLRKLLTEYARVAIETEQDKATVEFKGTLEDGAARIHRIVAGATSMLIRIRKDTADALAALQRASEQAAKEAAEQESAAA